MKLGKIVGGYDVQLLSFDIRYSEPLKRQVLCLSYLFNGGKFELILHECISLVKLEETICKLHDLKDEAIVNIINGQIVNSMNELINYLDIVDMEINNKLWYLNSCGVMQPEINNNNCDKIEILN